jgi:hypothetical protein
VAQIADVGHKAPIGSSRPCRHRFRRGTGQFWAQKITVVTLESNLNDDITRFYFSIFFDFLAASNAMVADEIDIRR